jgi:hypothetical protein
MTAFCCRGSGGPPGGGRGGGRGGRGGKYTFCAVNSIRNKKSEGQSRRSFGLIMSWVGILLCINQ